MKSSSLFLQAANEAGMAWALKTVKQQHYLHQNVFPRSMPMAYLILQQRDEGFARVGCLIFNHTQCRHVKGWFGTPQQVAAGAAYLTQWQLLNLARVWESPDIQDPDSPHFSSNASSRVISTALRHVVRDYLLVHPPPFLDRPWRLAECMTYLHSKVFRGTIYRANNFTVRRDNGRGLVTYSRALRTLNPREEDLIREASRLNRKNRKRRAARRFLEEVTWSPFLRLYPVPDRLPQETEPGEEETWLVA